MRLFQKEAKKDDPDPKALSCYGLYLPELGQTWLWFVDGRPVSAYRLIDLRRRLLIPSLRYAGF